MRLALAVSRAAMQTLHSHHMRAAALARCSGATAHRLAAPLACPGSRAACRITTVTCAALDVATEAAASAAAPGSVAAKGAAAVSTPRERRTFKPRISVRELLVSRPQQVGPQGAHPLTASLQQRLAGAAPTAPAAGLCALAASSGLPTRPM
jgi:hypothetical protein